MNNILKLVQEHYTSNNIVFENPLHLEVDDIQIDNSSKNEVDDIQINNSSKDDLFEKDLDEALLLFYNKNNNLFYKKFSTNPDEASENVEISKIINDYLCQMLDIVTYSLYLKMKNISPNEFNNFINKFKTNSTFISNLLEYGVKITYDEKRLILSIEYYNTISVITYINEKLSWYSLKELPNLKLI